MQIINIFYLLQFSISLLAAQNSLRIGAIFEDGDAIKEIALRKGIAAANNLLANSEKLRSTQLVADVRYIPKNDNFLAFKQTCSLLNKGIIALVGPTSIRTSNHVQSACDTFAIPHLETHWTFRDAKDYYSINLNPHHSSYGSALLDYVKHLGNWNNLGIIYYQDDSLLKFEELLNSFKDLVLVRQWQKQLGNYMYVLKDLRAAKMHRFIVDIPYWKVKQFLTIASALNMTTEYYSYIFTCWDLHLVDLSDYKMIRGANISTLSLLPFIKPHEDYGLGQIVRELQNEVYDIESKLHGNIFRLLTTEAALVYDSILLLAHGLKQLANPREISTASLSCADNQQVWEHGHSLINYIRAFPPPIVQGISGDIAFDQKGYRANFTLTILEVTAHGYQEYGNWKPSPGLYVKKDSSQTHMETSQIIQNRTLRVVTMESEPFVIVNKRNSKTKMPSTDPADWSGFCIDLLNEIAKEASFNYTVSLVADNQYGSVNESNPYPNGKQRWNGLIGDLIELKADLAVASLTITYEREKVIDFTTPFMSLGLSIIFKKPKKENPHLFSFLQPLSATVWGYIVGAYVSVSCLLYLVARFSPYEWYNPYPCNRHSQIVENQFSLSNSMWFIIGSLMQQGSDLAPRAVSTRIISGIWWFFTLIMVSSYTANLAAFLTVERMQNPIESAEALSQQTDIKYGTLTGGSTYNFFKKSEISTYKRMWKFMERNPDVFVNDTKVGIDRVLKEDGKYAFILESTWNEYYRERDCENLMQVGGLLDSKGYGIGLPHGSIYRNSISEAILKLRNEQKTEKLRRKWFQQHKVTNQCIKKATEAQSLKIEQVGGVFAVLVFGILTSIMLSIIEFAIRARKGKKHERKPLIKEICKELEFASRCMTTKSRPNEDSSAFKQKNLLQKREEKALAIKEILQAENNERQYRRHRGADHTDGSQHQLPYPLKPHSLHGTLASNNYTTSSNEPYRDVKRDSPLLNVQHKETINRSDFNLQPTGSQRTPHEHQPKSHGFFT